MDSSKHVAQRILKGALEAAPQIATVVFDLPEGTEVHVPFMCGPGDSDAELIEAAHSRFPYPYRPEDAIAPPRVQRRAVTADDFEVV